MDRVTAAQIAEALGKSRSTIARLASSESWIYEEEAVLGGRQRVYPLATLPSDVQSAVLVKFGPAAPTDPAPAAPGTDPVPTSDTLWAWFDRQSQKTKADAQAKLDAVLLVQSHLDTGWAKMNAVVSVSAALGISAVSIRRWFARVQGVERADWLPTLADRYVGRTKTAECDEAAWDFFKADYLRPEQPAAAACYQRLKRAAIEHGWKLPSLRTLERRLEREIAPPVLVYLRNGEEALRRLYPAQERDETQLRALEWINGDGYEHNVFVDWDGEIIRPRTWFWQDIYSRKLLAWRTDVSENADLIRLALGDLLDNFGIPSDCTVDNTRAAANKWLTGRAPWRHRFKIRDDDPLGILPQLGIDVHWTSVFKGKGHGQAKPVERTFGAGGIGEVVDKHPAFSGAYTGPNPTAKPENYRSRAIPRAQFEQILAEEVHAWNAREGRRTRVCAGRASFDEVFFENYRATPIRKATAEQRRLWLYPGETSTVRPDGSFTLEVGGAVGLGKNRYHGESLYAFKGKKIVVRFDPQHLHGAVHCYTLDGRYIGGADWVPSTGFGDSEAAREYNRNRNQFVKANKAAAAAEQRMNAVAAAAYLPGGKAPEGESRVIAPVFPKSGSKFKELETGEVVDVETGEVIDADALFEKAVGAAFSDFEKQMKDKL